MKVENISFHIHIHSSFLRWLRLGGWMETLAVEASQGTWAIKVSKKSITYWKKSFFEFKNLILVLPHLFGKINIRVKVGVRISVITIWILLPAFFTSLLYSWNSFIIFALAEKVLIFIKKSFLFCQC